MRRELYRSTAEAALDLFHRATVMHLASVLPGVSTAAPGVAAGEPLLRVLHPIVLGGDVYFHSADEGEKTLALGARAVLTAHEIVASIPSYFVDPVRACPATTLYRSAMAHGVLEGVEEPEKKAAVLRALMEKLQPEGGYEPISPAHKLYAGAIRAIRIVRLRPERIEAKHKLGQNRTPEQRTRLLEHLWERGAPGDPEAIELVREACPDTLEPVFLRMPPGLRACVSPGADDARQAALLLEGTYWNGAFSADELAAAHLGSPAWITAREGERVVASARAVSDGAKRAWIYDVVVAPEWRGRGVGEAVMRLLLDHPRVRGARSVELGTRDAQTFYRRMGFVLPAELPPRDYTSTHMVLMRPPQPARAAASDPARCPPPSRSASAHPR